MTITNRGLLVKCIALPLLVGVASAILTMGGMRTFALLEQPPLSPPGWLFGVVWTILYTLMGVSSFLIVRSGAEEKKINRALSLYMYQLIVNFLWPTFFFQFQWYLFSFFWLLLLWVLVLAMIIRFYEISRLAAYLQIPYLIWLTFAAYLNLGVWWLNRA